MTVLPPGATCALSKEPLKSGDDVFITSGEFLPKGDPLHDLCGQPICWKHYAAWEERPRFARAYVAAWINANRKNPFWWQVYLDDRIYVSVNPQRGIEEASVRLQEVGSDIRVPLTKWSQWLDTPEQVTPGLHKLEYELLKKALPDLRDRLPDAHAVVDAIDPNEKKPKGKKR